MKEVHKEYRVMTVKDVSAVICTGRDINAGPYPSANFGGTGMALCGLLMENQKLADFIKERENRIRLLNLRYSERCLQMDPLEWLKTFENDEV